MFKNLKKNFELIFKNISSKYKFTENNIKDILIEIKKILLEADVSLQVIKELLNNIHLNFLNKSFINYNITPLQIFIKICYKELKKIMGDVSELDIKYTPSVILITGLQGSGKTTTVAKLALFIKKNHKKKILLVSIDIYRPAAIEQLKILSKEIYVDFFSYKNNNIIEISEEAIKYAIIKNYDVVIIDTAGRLHIDNYMMNEIKILQNTINPVETLFIVDAMTGQEAANISKAFNEKLSLTGIILTKIDGDNRGGAALSIRFITGKPIKFMGIGEKINAFEIFSPDSIISSILGMGDIISFIEENNNIIDKNKLNLFKDKFNLNDFIDYMTQIKKMGGINNLFYKFPFFNKSNNIINDLINEKDFIKFEAIIKSMTKLERKYPHLINDLRKLKICLVSGTNISDFNNLMKIFKNINKFMKTLNNKEGLNKISELLNNVFNNII